MYYTTNLVFFHSLVRKWLGLNTHSTQDIIFDPQWHGELEVLNVSA